MAAGWVDPFRRLWGWLSRPASAPVTPGRKVIDEVDLPHSVGDAVNLPHLVSDTLRFTEDD